jgi:hypothetical protein
VILGVTRLLTMKFKVEDSGGTGADVDALWVWLTVHGPGNESIAALNHLPLVMANQKLAESFLPAMRQMSTKVGKGFRLVKMVRQEVVSEIKVDQR